MKEYFNRLITEPKKFELVYWWVIRAIMIYAVIDSLFVRHDTQQFLQSLANLVLMFLWEIFQMFSGKHLLHYVPPYVQDFLIFGLFLASFGGAYLNFYYSIKLYDVIFHAVGGLAGAFGGYEIVTAMQKRDKVKASVPIVLLCAFGFSFFAGTGWELFEFTFDQVAPQIGDAQHWSLALAEEAAVEHGIGLPNIIDARDPMRYAVIDTMEDIIFNTVGAVIAFILLKIRPYNHRGKHNVNDMFDDYVPKKEKVAASK